jgi:hypothetical protein
VQLHIVGYTQEAADELGIRQPAGIDLPLIVRCCY